MESLRRKGFCVDINRRFWYLRRLSDGRSVFVLVDGGGMYLIRKQKKQKKIRIWTLFWRLIFGQKKGGNVPDVLWHLHEDFIVKNVEIPKMSPNILIMEGRWKQK